MLAVLKSLVPGYLLVPSKLHLFSLVSFEYMDEGGQWEWTVINCLDADCKLDDGPYPVDIGLGSCKS